MPKRSKPKSKPKKSKPKTRPKVNKPKMGKSRCWPGYKPVPGKMPYTKGSCKKM